MSICLRKVPAKNRLLLLSFLVMLFCSGCTENGGGLHQACLAAVIPFGYFSIFPLISVYVAAIRALDIRAGLSKFGRHGLGRIPSHRIRTRDEVLAEEEKWKAEEEAINRNLSRLHQRVLRWAVPMALVVVWIATMGLVLWGISCVFGPIPDLLPRELPPVAHDRK
jgi:hypothetical protein